ncbi:hypothetical protein RHSIM_Rhsim13G0020800 [Rhododendron simsii]|uniref:Endonuclease/exonuclease/phosphatase domain-containing protein n=1 Tax=Rhododendron simsii TaxID=118357 RepID=A0A834L6L2_RHOSS|nr:hypothetical protein RHSIM_Rhsim13G0020800 [Rhododendron simsii]
MLKIFNKNLKRLCAKLRRRWPLRRRRSSMPKVVVKKYGKSSSKSNLDPIPNGSATVHPNGPSISPNSQKPIRVATFNAALFSMAAVNDDNTQARQRQQHGFTLRSKSAIDRPKSILKQSPLHPSSTKGSGSENLPTQEKFAKSRLRVSINLPDNEISLSRSGRIRFDEGEKEKEGGTAVASTSSSVNKSRILRGKTPVRSASSLPLRMENEEEKKYRSSRTVVEVLRELDADILGLQDVKAEEEMAMKPLSDLASALGMNYVFAESWAPEYGNAILSKWPIKKWKVQKIFDDSDFRNVLRATIDIPWVGEVNFQSTLLDHLDENWRMKQINAIIESNDGPHILAGGLNSFDETDYSPERWTDIVKYYEEMGKPTPKAEVMRFLKSKQYTDAKDFAGECESVVMIAKGQSVQGTCKYGTRVDYILASSDSPYKFVPGSYSVFSSKGTSDHHIVKVDITMVESSVDRKPKQQQRKQRIVKITNSSSTKGIWKTDRGR